MIVMLSDIIKDRKVRGKHKQSICLVLSVIFFLVQEVCFPYWPKVDKKNTQKYGGYAVSTSEFNKQDGYNQRIFTITGPQVCSYNVCYRYSIALIGSECHKSELMFTRATIIGCTPAPRLDTVRLR